MKKYLRNPEEFLAAIALLFMTLIAFINVIARYCFTSSISFTEELVTKMFVLISLFGAAIAAKRRSHLGLTLITDSLPERTRKYVVGSGYILSAIFSIVLMYLGAKMTIYEFSVGQLTAGMQWPEWIFGIYVPIGAAFIAFRFIMEAIKLFTNRDTKQEGNEV
ncbi:MAG TPA: TRAP transporter small permease [Bacillota bacterium]|nr:TRAP transporter small permease [Bacillota bacterium]HPW40223.1 TRAP transporter small permease [Bacillota bacterium]